MQAAATKVAVRRLKRRKDFLRVAAQRTKWVTPGLILQAAPTPDVPHGDKTQTPESPLSDAPTLAETRVGFTVSKKVGNAVKRNRARRRLKAAADALLPELAVPGIDYVVIGRGATVERPFEDLLHDLRTALKRVGTGAKPLGERRPRGPSSERTHPKKEADEQ
jgi:ribonuclease P protein component